MITGFVPVCNANRTKGDLKSPVDISCLTGLAGCYTGAILFALVRNELCCKLGFHVDDVQIGQSHGVRIAPPLLPVTQSREGNTVRPSKVLLGHFHSTPDLLDVNRRECSHDE